MATSTLFSSVIANNAELSFASNIVKERSNTFSSGNCQEYLSTRPRVVIPVAATRRVVVPVDSDKVGKVRPKQLGGAPVKLLARVEQLRLLSKAEKAGLLSAAERLGFSLSNIERLGLLSKAESFGVLSAATNKETPGQLQGLALLLLAVGPAVVYFIPEDNTIELVAQCVGAAAFVMAGAAAVAGSSLVSTLQKET